MLALSLTSTLLISLLTTDAPAATGGADSLPELVALAELAAADPAKTAEPAKIAAPAIDATKAAAPAKAAEPATITAPANSSSHAETKEQPKPTANATTAQAAEPKPTAAPAAEAEGVEDLVKVAPLPQQSAVVSSEVAYTSAGRWRTVVDAEVTAGNRRTLGEFETMVPIMQRSDRLLFLDIRGQFDDDENSEGNFGLGYRQIIDNSWILGSYAFFDLKNSRFDNTYVQGMVGLEALTEEWDFRINGYVPDNKVEVVNNLNAAQLVGNQIVVRQGIEKAYAGFDAEVGARIATFGCNVNEIRVFAGGYFFTAGDSRFEDITGPRARIEMRLYDLAMLGDGSRLTLGAELQHDDVRDTQAFVSARVRIPLGAEDACCSPCGLRKMSVLERRMQDQIYRDVDIVSNAGAFGNAELAKNARTGQVISQALVVNGTTAAPETVISGAGANSIVIVDGSQGLITTNATAILSDGQVLMGGGSSLAVIGCETGSAATFLAPGSRGTLAAANDTFNVVQLANNTTVQDLNVTGGDIGLFGATDLAGFCILRNLIENTNRDGIRIAGDAAGEIVGNRVNNAGNGAGGGDGIDINGTASGLIANNVVTGSRDNGFEIRRLTGTLTGNSSSGNLGEGYAIRNAQDGSMITNNTATNNGDDGFDFENTGATTIANNTATGNADEGFDFDQSVGQGAMVTNNTAISNQGNGFGINGNLAGIFSGNRVTGNGITDNGIFIDGNIADTGRFQNNIVETVTDDGIQITGNLNTGSVVSGNISRNAGDDGFDIGGNIRDGATFDSNQALNSGNDGFEIVRIRNGGIFTNNIANDNTAAGYNITTIDGGAVLNNNTGADNGSNDTP